MRSSLDYAGFAQLCGRSPIMREIMRAHNRIIPRSLLKSVAHGQRDAWPTVTFPAIGHRRSLTGTNLFCLVTEARACKQPA